MISTTAIVELGVAAALVAGYFFAAKPGRELLYLAGSAAMWAGTDSLLTGRIGQFRKGGPALEGWGAVVGSLFLMGLGLWFLYGAMKPTPETASNDSEEDITPNNDNGKS